jgi:hypothetical protein
VTSTSTVGSTSAFAPRRQECSSQTVRFGSSSPGFVSFAKASGLPFKPYADFKAAAIVERGDLYRRTAKKVWNPDDLLAVAERSELRRDASSPTTLAVPTRTSTASQTCR